MTGAPRPSPIANGTTAAQASAAGIPADHSSPTDAQIHAIRAFNRFYTRRAGVLDPYLKSDMSLTDVRVLYEIHHGGGHITASDIAKTIGHDNGYLSRILKRFDKSGWVSRRPNPADARQSFLALTGTGEEVYAPLQAKSHAEAAALVAELSAADRVRVIEAMDTIETLLRGATASAEAETETDTTPAHPAPAPATTPAVTLRGLQPGDLGWVVQQHGEIYAKEYDWDVRFEALVAGIVEGFVKNYDASRERVWIAEVGGERVGSVFLVQGSTKATAKLRLLILGPGARGLGLGSRLVDEAIAFAREAGYEKVELWTHSCLLAARAIYAKRGFVLTSSEVYDGFGQTGLVGEFYELDLGKK
ncbi:Putative HTH-type DNA-binding domain-containing acetyltransferase YbfA [Vanrija pseudolonga]|uniref:HTH-type DNA-binding domain-containing acetyltransferase YbfA n=1 Tax=Vanrija pseudolonga TaxID=143232 RepID=A0AAF0YDV8_9TREE|nr:Putative HTH-type DNA-binding domain-containing acetyltransferase YbfA [Vanrija pseudolonga]